MRVGDEPDLDAGAVDFAQHIRHVLVHGKVVARRPFVVDVARRSVHSGPAAAHAFDDAARVVDEELRIVDAVTRHRASLAASATARSNLTGSTLMPWRAQKSRYPDALERGPG